MEEQTIALIIVGAIIAAVVLAIIISTVFNTTLYAAVTEDEEDRH